MQMGAMVQNTEQHTRIGPRSPLWLLRTGRSGDTGCYVTAWREYGDLFIAIQGNRDSAWALRSAMPPVSRHAVAMVAWLTRFVTIASASALLAIETLSKRHQEKVMMTKTINWFNIRCSWVTLWQDWADACCAALRLTERTFARTRPLSAAPREGK